MAKVYAVRKGHQTGIFNSWQECQKMVAGYPSAEFKSFITLEEAQAYLDARDIYEERLKNDLQAGFGVAFVDGSFDENTGKYGSGVIAINPNGEQDEFFRAGDNQKYCSSKNVAGEVMATLLAMDWAVTAKLTKLRIYYDYEGIEKWISGGWKAESCIARDYVNIFSQRYKDILDIEFFKVKGHSNNKYNERADQLAKSALRGSAKVIRGEGWSTISGVKRKQFSNYILALKKEIERLTVDTDSNVAYKEVHLLECQGDRLTITFFPDKQKILFQGAVTPLFQIILSEAPSYFDVSDRAFDILVGNIYRANVDTEKVSNEFNGLLKFPADLPDKIKLLARQSVINLQVSYYCVDYTQMAFPALKALEGYLKYLFSKNKIIITNKGFGDYFDFDGVQFVLKNRKLNFGKEMEGAYNYLHSQRHTLFHYGEIINKFDSTRTLSSKQDADEIIRTALALISS